MTSVTGHRGGRNLWPENSLSGFVRAAALGVDTIEFDVHPTKDGDLVVIHDATLDRTTAGTGPVHDLPASEREKVMLRGPDGAVTHESLPSLEQTLQVLDLARGPRLHVELKADGDHRPYPALVPAVVDAVRQHGLADRVHLTSFDTSVLRQCLEVAPEIARLQSAAQESVESAGGVTALMDQAEGLVDILALHHEVLDEHWDEVSARWPLDRLCVWTVNDRDEMLRWMQRGVGHLTTDRPDLALAVRASLPR